MNLRFLHLNDGIPSPAGPKNAGLDAATGTYMCMLDSDDYLEPGALGWWYQQITAEQADAVIAPVRHEAGGIIKTPRARPCRVRDLDPVKDGLAYATSMRGLWKSSIDGVGDVRYVPGLSTGEDLALGLQMYFSGAKFLFPKNGPAYVLGNSAEDRVTDRLLPLNDEFRAMAVLPEEWLQNLSVRQRKSIASKIARTSLIGAIRRRGPEHDWACKELAAVQAAAGILEGMAPAYRRAMTACDSKLLESSLTASEGSEFFRNAIKNHRDANLVSKIFTRKLQHNLDVDSQLRQLLRAALDRRS
ncbi:glycosyltransferase family A protein [Specibacter sp. NPDC078709]|uniref:glycosyltransferase family A protein n=1 Tax=Specibacter sp. NPDC078709 TaxID=3154364 RepID=UPI00342D0FFD